MNKNKLYSILKNKTLLNGALFSFFSFLNRGVSFLLLLILADYIEPDQYGQLSLFNTIVMFLGYFAGLSTAGYLSVSFFKKNKEQFREDFTAIWIITFFVSISIGVFLLFFSDYLSPVLKVPSLFLFFGVAIALFDILYQINLDYFRVQEKIIKYGLLSCSFGILNMILTLYLVIGENYNWAGFVYAQLICDLLLGFFSIFYFSRLGIFKIPKKISIFKSIVLWGLPIIPHMAAGWVKTGLDRYIIEDSHSMSDVGIFSFAFNMMSVITMIGTAFNKTNSVNIYQTLSSSAPINLKIKSLIKKEHLFSLMYAIISIFISIIGCLFVYLLIPNYSAAIPYFFILSIYGFFICLYYVYCNYLFYFNKTKNLMYITFGSSIIHLLLSLILTPLSLYFTCSIYGISQIVIFFLVYKESRKCLSNLT